MHNKYSYFFFFGFSAFLVFAGCGREVAKKEEPSVAYKQLREPLIDANRRQSKREHTDIENYIRRKEWKMEQTGTGLRYMVYQNGNGPRGKDGMVATLNYEISLLDGTVCYTSEKSGPTEFLIGQDHIETGIHEVMHYLKVGDKAKVILPSHLAHGLTGDAEKIPMRSSVVYDLEVLSLK